MRRLHLAAHPGFLADHQHARAVVVGDHVAVHVAVDAQTVDETQFTDDQGAFADQAADWRLFGSVAEPRHRSYSG
jgi:hypothetical protein